MTIRRGLRGRAAAAIPAGLISVLLSAAPPADASPLGVMSASSGTAGPVQVQVDLPVPIGSSMASAAASCWEIKVNQPSASDGVYWLRTPKLIAPEQFHCDMTTDGGGWVLIGRGREGWRSEYEGAGNPAQVRGSVTGPGAFPARQLPAAMVDGLLDGGRVDALTDGVRIHRAARADGSGWQDATVRFASRDRWAWTFRGRHPVTASFDGAAPIAGTSLRVGQDNGLRMLDTDVTQAQQWTGGFAYGAQIKGDPASTSYLWSATAGGSSPRPFAQVYLRPRLITSQLDWGTLPDQGLPAIQQSALPQTRAQPTVWGVSGLAGNAGQDTEMRTEVQDFAQIGDTMYVGGNFARVQRDGSGSGAVEQPFLAAFDVHTGEFRPGFRPSLDNQVKALAALPDGRLAVGGEFGTVDGQARVGLAVLNPATGALDTSFPVRMENRLTGGLVSLRSLKVSGDWLYLGGAFTHLAGAGPTVYARSGARIALSTGRPDAGWNPNLNGTATEVTPSADGSRTYLTGYFTTSNGVAANKMAALSTAPGAAVIAWDSRYSVPATQQNTFQFTVTETPSRVVVGGSEHSAFSYDRDTLQFRYGAISMAGGDFQTSVADPNSGVVFAGCHCDDFLYSGVTKYGWPSSFQQGDRLGFVGAWNAASMSYLPEFNPIMKARKGYGAWASAVDTSGALWIGGSFATSLNTRGQNQFSGGFVRFAARDTAAPPAPTNLAITADGAGVQARWTEVSEPGVSYEVLSGGHVIDVTTQSSASLPFPSGPQRYAVRAVDAAGNRSATTPAVAFDPAAVPAPQDILIASDSTWRWRWASAALPANWTSVGFGDSGWSAGAAPLGFGSTGLGTTISTTDSPRPVTAQFRRTVQVADPASVREVGVSIVANDGAVAYLNGVEIGRKNLPAGTITQSTYATAAPREASAVTAPLEVVVPRSALVAGTNVFAVQTHLNYRSTPDASMHLQATVTIDR